jgi:GTPase involved in cell partitioning and DNA repair
LFEKEIKAVIELASFDTFSETHLDFLSQLTESIGIVLNTIEANTRTESLLVQSQSLTDELRRTNEELQDKAHLLVKQKKKWKQRTRKWKKQDCHWKKKPSNCS